MCSVLLMYVIISYDDIASLAQMKIISQAVALLFSKHICHIVWPVYQHICNMNICNGCLPPIYMYLGILFYPLDVNKSHPRRTAFIASRECSGSGSSRSILHGHIRLHVEGRGEVWHPRNTPIQAAEVNRDSLQGSGEGQDPVEGHSGVVVVIAHGHKDWLRDARGSICIKALHGEAVFDVAAQRGHADGAFVGSAGNFGFAGIFLLTCFLHSRNLMYVQTDK
jgi:hypothetical protein